MKKICLGNLQYLLLALLLMAMTGCGASNTASTAGSDAGNSSLTAKLVWGDATKSAAKTVAAVPAGVAAMRMTVTGTGANGAIPVVRSEIPVTTETASGSVNGVYPGNVTLSVQALNSAGAVVYEGYALNIVVQAGAVADAGTVFMTPPIVKAADAGCLECHENKLDITGQNLIANYKQSGHYTNSNTGCAACHGAQHNDLTPAASGRCFECHGSLGAKHTSATALTVGDTFPARYLNATSTNCSACHEPHNPIKGIGQQERKDWAESAHGDVNGLAWTHYDFTASDRGACAACHTVEGFKRAINDGFVSKAPLSTGTGTGKNTLNCDACHSGNDFALRELSANTDPTTGGYIAKYGGFGATPKATAVFSNQGESNLCIPCHAARENGDSLKAGTGTIAAPISYNFTNQSFVNPHYLTSAGVWQGTAGFKFYSSSDWYHVNKPFHGVPTADLKLPLREEITDSRISGAAEKGSCVACHMGAKGDHKWDVFEAVKFKSYSSTVAYTGCLGCHSNTDNGRNRYYPTVATQPSRVASGGYVQQRALDMLKWQLKQIGIYYNGSANPYFFTSATGVAATDKVLDWTTQVVNDTDTVANNRGLRTMGAAMNYKTLSQDKGAAAHNSYLTRHLIADSLIYLQKGAVLADRTAFVADVNQLISFTSYSTAVTPPLGGAPTDGINASIANLKQFLTTWTTAAGNGTGAGVRLKQ